jgi:hypothetical protein
VLDDPDDPAEREDPDGREDPDRDEPDDPDDPGALRELLELERPDPFFELPRPPLALIPPLLRFGMSILG